MTDWISVPDTDGLVAGDRIAFHYGSREFMGTVTRIARSGIVYVLINGWLSSLRYKRGDMLDVRRLIWSEDQQSSKGHKGEVARRYSLGRRVRECAIEAAK